MPAWLDRALVFAVVLGAAHWLGFRAWRRLMRARAAKSAGCGPDGCGCEPGRPTHGRTTG
jgi:hypothetical protein